MWHWIASLFGKSKTQEPDDGMKYLIVGLGNMGPEYDHTRHNIGFDVVDELARRHEAEWAHKTLGDLAHIRHRGRHIYLLKPSTYMNRSGKAVRYWLQQLKLTPDRLLVIVDDINLPLGKLRLRPGGSDGGHNGLKDINQQLGTNQYARLRIGIGNDFPKGRQAEYVLGKWKPEEAEKLPDIITRAADAALAFTTIGLQRAMNEYNKG